MHIASKTYLKLIENCVADLLRRLLRPVVSDVGILELGETWIPFQELAHVVVRRNRVAVATICLCNRTDKSLKIC